VQITPFFGLFAQTFWLLWQRERQTALPLCAGKPRTDVLFIPSSAAFFTERTTKRALLLLLIFLQDRHLVLRFKKQNPRQSRRGLHRKL
jgi:hypothetical protein